LCSALKVSVFSPFFTLDKEFFWRNSTDGVAVELWRWRWTSVKTFNSKTWLRLYARRPLSPVVVGIAACKNVEQNIF
jgi:hypothetical protein